MSNPYRLPDFGFVRDIFEVSGWGLTSMQSIADAQTQFRDNLSAFGALATGSSSEALASLEAISHFSSPCELAGTFATVQLDDLENVTSSLMATITAGFEIGALNSLPDVQGAISSVSQPLTKALRQLEESFSVFGTGLTPDVLPSIDRLAGASSIHDIAAEISSIASSYQLPDLPTEDYSGLFETFTSIEASLQGMLNQLPSWALEHPHAAAAVAVDTTAEAIRPVCDTATESTFARTLTALARWADEHPHQADVETCAGLVVTLTALWVLFGNGIFAEAAFLLALELIRVLRYPSGHGKDKLQA